MNVSDFDRYISSYLDGELNPSKTKEFENLIKNNSELNQKFQSYKKMLDELNNLKTIKTSDNFLNRLHEKIHNVESLEQFSPPIKTIFGYNYIAISGIAAALGIFMISLSFFIGSESFPLLNLDKLSAKNIQERGDENNSPNNLIVEEDSLIENEDLELPKIHLVGGRK